MNVLVVNPYVTDFKLYDEWMHPIGLYMLIDLLQANDISVHYFDCLEREQLHSRKKNGTGKIKSREIERPVCFSALRRKYKCYGCSEESFREYCNTLPTLTAIFVGSMMTYWAEGVLRTVRLLRNIFPDTPIICGGIAAQLIPEYFKRMVPFCHIYTGSLPPAGETVSFPGINRSLHVPETMSLLPGLQCAPEYSHGPLLLSFGCPMRCSYCASSVLQPQFRMRPTKTVCNELEMMVTRFNRKHFALYDDAVLVYTDTLLLPLLKFIIKMNLYIQLHTPNGLHLKYVTPELLEVMKEAGFSTLRFGFESGIVKNRDYTGRKADVRLLFDALSLITRYSFPNTGVYVMGGLPASTPESMAEEMKVIAAAGARVKPVFLSPVPGTALYRHYLEQFPQIAKDPMWHNDLFFITQLPGWDATAVEHIRSLARTLNEQSF